MKIGSLFSGIGGLELGLERAGMETRWQVENDDWCTKVLTKHWPDVPKYKDIHDINPHELEPVDLICGGFPCQPVSLAGSRKAQDDDRWLWPQFARIVRVVRPRYVLVENVPGLLSAGFGDVAGDLAALGYDFEWESIPAAAVGAPHLRYRVFIVAYSKSVGSEGGGLQQRQSRQPEATLRGRSGVEGTVAYADSPTRRPARSAGQTVFRPGQIKRPGRRSSSIRTDWAVEPAVGRVANGIPRRVDRLRGLGNAVVPQVAQWVGEQIMAYEQLA